MNREGWKKFQILFSTLLALVFAFFTDAIAQDLNKVVKKRNIHPKLQSSLWELGNKHKNGVSDFQAFARSRKMIIENENEVTVYLISVPGTTIDETTLQAYGAEIIKSADSVMKAWVPVNMLEVIADSMDGVSFIKLPDRAIPLAVESEGVGLTGASSYHSAGYTGSGVKVAVIDVGFAGLSSAISSGELPSTVVKIDCTGSSCVSTDFSSETENHGTAVSEIVYDMAPGSQLYLIKISDSLDLKDAKDYCISNGIKIINHSLGLNNTNFQSGECYSSNPVCTAEDAYSRGILWVNAAGNYAKKHYEATFSDTDGDGWHNVSADDETINIEAIAGDTVEVYLTWNAWPTTDQDYDLYLYDSASNLVAYSIDVQSETQWPTESISYSVLSDGTYHLSIKKYDATSNHKLEVYSNNHDITPAVASSSMASPADASNVMAVGAINHANWTTGPQESFSSQGPTNDGRTKPEISGPDGVSGHTYGSFYGTSASAPHVAGAAALILSKNPTYSVSQLWKALTFSVVDIGTSGQDNIYGHGRLDLLSKSVKQFVTRFYQECLGRTPASNRLNNWAKYLLSGEKTGADVAYGFVFSPEFLGMNTTDQEFLYVLYKAFFNRQPDSGGYARWLNELSCNTPIVGQKAARKNILNAFLGAPEFKTLCSNYGITRGSVTYVRPTCSTTSIVNNKRSIAKNSSSLLGTYTLTDFLIVFDDETKIGSGDFAYWDGTTEINSLNIHQQITLNGTTGTVPSQSYSITPATGTYDGIIHTTTAAGVSYDIYYYTSENQIVMVTDATNLGISGTMYEYWEKTSDSFSTSTSEPFSSNDDVLDPNNYNLGMIVGEIIK